jgi:hypothetical protein
VVLRGFGEQHLDTPSYKLLTSNHNREASINGVAFHRFYGTRPEVVIPLPASDDPPSPPESEEFAAGQRVRLTHWRALHSVGTIQHILPQLALLPNKLKAPAASVQLENGETVTVPLANLEILA